MVPQATQSIPAGTVVDISPVLLFPKENYTAHAKYTIVDDYAFVWGDGHMALALGLGTSHTPLLLLTHRLLSCFPIRLNDEPRRKPKSLLFDL